MFHRSKERNKKSQHKNNALLYGCFHNHRIKFNNISINTFLFVRSSPNTKHTHTERLEYVYMLRKTTKSHDHNLQLVAQYFYMHGKIKKERNRKTNDCCVAPV